MKCVSENDTVDKDIPRLYLLLLMVDPLVLLEACNISLYILRASGDGHTTR